MYLLNGVPPIIGISLMHVTILNILAIVIEYHFIRKRHTINRLLMRTIISNLVSLFAGVIVLYTLPEWLDGNIARTDSDMNTHDRLTMVLGLAGLFLANVLIEFPAYLAGNKNSASEKMDLFQSVLQANLLSNLPVFIMYGLLML